MSNYRLKRVTSMIIQELNKILSEEVKDEVLKNVSVTDATVDNDLTFATIYFMTRLEDTKMVEERLNKAASFIRYNLANSLDLRSTPELRFIYDDSIDRGEKIEEILEDIKDEESN